MQKRILIAEDDATIAQALVRRLRARGYDPVAADSPERALTTFEEGRPDLVIASLTLPRDGGARLCRDIRSRPLGALVPILFLGTGREAIDSVSEAIAAGADHYFKKPDGIGDLLGKVGTYIGPGEDVPAPREDERGPVTTAEWAELDALLHAPAGDSGEREAHPDLRRDPGPEHDPRRGRELERRHHPASSGNTLENFALIRGEAIIGATASRHFL